MARVYYSDNKITDFIEAAKEMGIAPAIRHMGYPAYATAVKWFDERNEARPDIDSLMQKAAELRLFYGDKEKKFAVMTLIDRIVEQLHEKDLDADAINKLGNALNKAIQTFNLIDGKSTQITESHTKDGADLAIVDMLNEAKAKNAAKEEQFK